MTTPAGSPKSKEARAHAAQARAVFLEGRPADAERFARRALDLAPLDIEANYLLANALRVQARHDEAAIVYGRVVTIDPKHAGAFNEYGAVLFALNRLTEAEAAIGRAIAINPKDASAFNNLARLYFPDPAKAAWALAQADKAIALKPTMAEAHSNRGTALYLLGRFVEAAESHRRAIALKPNLAEAHNNLGNDLQKLGDVVGAVAAYRAALVCAPGYADAHLNLALALLAVGDLAEGWQAYEHRWQSASFAGTARPFTQPRWNGKDPTSLLIWGEQGIGDEVLYAGLVADLATDLAAGRDIVWEMDARLVPLMQRSFPHATAVGRSDPPDAKTTAPTAQIPAASLGQFLRPTSDAFPARAAYLTPDPARRGRYREALVGASGLRLVGLSWISKNPDIGVHKTLALAALAPILKLPGIRFVDLQYGDTAEARAEIAHTLGVEIHHLPELDLRDDIDGLAALLAACDTCVTVSNTTAHLAGALGVPTAVLVPSGNGKLWYWGSEARTPWYPSLHLYRQPHAGNWTPAIDAVAADLAQGVVAPQSAGR